jgi:hypothetical protein
MTDQHWWGMNPNRDDLDQLIGIVHDALFAEDDTDGPVFRWVQQHLPQDDDPYLGCAADQVAFVLLDRADEVIDLIAKVRVAHAEYEAGAA